MLLAELVAGTPFAGSSTRNSDGVVTLLEPVGATAAARAPPDAKHPRPQHPGQSPQPQPQQQQPMWHLVT